MSAAKATEMTNLVAGIGKTGLSIARYLREHDADAIFYDTRTEPPGVDELREIWPEPRLLLGSATLPEGIERVIASPGIEEGHPIITAARKADIEVISDIQLFADQAAAPFVAITGTNGKSTVTTLLYYMCVADGRKVLAGGNLGEPALDLLGGGEPDVYVLELSSFQLKRTLNLPASVSVLLNISPDHLDWHGSFDDYAACKYRIFREAKAAVVNRADAQALETVADIERVVSFGMDAPEEGHFGIRVEDERRFLAFGDRLLIATDEMGLFGLHNQANALAALAAGELLDIRHASMLEVLVEFPGLPHRMQFVAQKDDVNYVNDSKATNVDAAIAAVNSVEGQVVLIAGGDGKGGDFAALAAAIETKLAGAVLIGRDAEAIGEALDEMTPRRFAGDMGEAVAEAAALAAPGMTVLLAPACASLDQYANYGARGDAFVEAVRGLRV
ncbi:MAG: UDP-N-acetylmuramoyl-L-alanine--D-glutamate ligase [Woeseiaceae bacterium]|jgi:UDP-N-acetylmuramoylalanine--D-glutamate ligase|nr:UDP-N-acetylmuramoyl-L-alanine--D-glutamate ligase [Woeseiaceae bacterium]